MRFHPYHERLAVYALLSIWICVIIYCTAAEKPSEVMATYYDPFVLVLDPGHGGLDGGAVSVTGERESKINYDIAKRAFALARFCGFRTLMTRNTYEIEYPAQMRSVAECKKWDTRSRVSFVNRFPEGVLLSIHQNYYPTASPHGIQVLYAGNEKSREIAYSLTEAFLQAFTEDSCRPPEAAGKDIYLLTHVTRPAVLVECGFLSNPTEAKKLETPDYQKKLSLVLISRFSNYRSRSF